MSYSFLWVYALNLIFFLPLLVEWHGILIISNAMFLLPAVLLAQHDHWWEAFDYMQIGFISSLYHWCDIWRDVSICRFYPVLHFLDHLYALCLFTSIVSPFLNNTRFHGLYRMSAWCVTFLLYCLIEDQLIIFVVLGALSLGLWIYCVRTRLFTWRLFIPLIPAVGAIWCFFAGVGDDYEFLHSLWHSLVATAMWCLFAEFLVVDYIKLEL
jgi:hypothetical protein